MSERSRERPDETNDDATINRSGGKVATPGSNQWRRKEPEREDQEGGGEINKSVCHESGSGSNKGGTSAEVKS